MCQEALDNQTIMRDQRLFAPEALYSSLYCLGERGRGWNIKLYRPNTNRIDTMNLLHHMYKYATELSYFELDFNGLSLYYHMQY